MNPENLSPDQAPTEPRQVKPMSMRELIKSGKLTEMFQRGVDKAIAKHIANGLPASGRLTQEELDARRAIKPL